MSVPADLLTAALLGSERAPWAPANVGELGEMIAGGSAGEVTLLRAIAVLGIYHQAGTLPAETTSPLIPPSGPETKSACGPRAAEHLLSILGQKHLGLLEEWLTLVALAERRAVEQHLPLLLETGRKRVDLQEPIRAIAGVRGEWLAQRNTEWKWFHGETEEINWETASQTGRLALLRKLRQSAPAQARALIESTWKEERADQRAEFLQALQISLSNEDEPFLEQALLDRSVVVNRAAADLLARLPESRLVKAAIERAVPLLRLEKKGMLLMRRNVLDLTLLESVDANLERDGIQKKVRFRGLGEKASWTAQLLAIVPPSEWTKRFKLEPKDLLDAAAQGDWRDLLRDAWALAAARHQDRAWASALAYDVSLQLDQWTPLVEILSADERDKLLFSLVKPDDALQLRLLAPGLDMHPGPWSLSLARRVIGLLGKGEMGGGAGQHYAAMQFRDECERLVTRFPLAVLQDLPANPPEALNKLYALLRFRAGMHRAIKHHE